MPSPAIDRLKEIKTLPQLVAYLRDELDWPISSDSTEDIMFEYEASELGLDKETAVKIKDIRQLRPLTGNQPWGIFFVNFEKKRLPVMVMRRILRSLVFKKRNTTGKSERQAWHASDLLFISAYGEEGDRAITFAHFVEDEELGGLAELRVLGWDDDDTPLHYGYVVEQLREQLKWRDEYQREPGDWRKNWRSAFELRHREVITTSKQLALSLAELAKKVRARVRALLRYEDGFGQIRKLEAAFRAALIHDLSDDDFADMYAQTITYGLFSAAVSRPAGIRGDNIVDMVPVTNPFLRDMLKTFLHLSGRKGRIDFDELGIQEVTSLLNSRNTHLDAVLRDFDNRNPQEDPVIHFYELFLTAYDKKKKIQRGVFYTPKPVVSYIVRSVHELLQAEFKLEHGLADTTTWGEMLKKHPDLKLPPLSDEPDEKKTITTNEFFVQILDPATGTATFLVEVIEVIHQHLKAQWNKGDFKTMPAVPATSLPRQSNDFSEYWNQYVALALLPRLHGYELMMAPYAIAHMKIGLKLWETGYRFGADERARIYLTNALEPWVKQLPLIGFDALAREAAAVNEIKRHKRFTVVVGNPPYSGESSNNGEWISSLIRDYHYVDGKPLGEANPRWLQDDYVKFIRLTQRAVVTTGSGAVSLITNHAYLDNATFRGARQSLLTSFPHAWFLDLHGNTKKKERHPNGSIDVNVFEIQQGVAISILLKGESRRAPCVEHSEIFGTREAKNEFLGHSTFSSTEWQPIKPIPPFYLFVPQDQTLFSEYQSFHKITEIMPVHSNGVVTARDHLCIGWSAEEAWNVVTDFTDMKPEEARTRFDLGRDSRDWQVRLAQADVRKDGPSRKRIVPIYYRPFDTRWTYFTGRSRGYLCMPRCESMRNMLAGKNFALITSRMTKGETFQHIQATRSVSEAIVMSPKTSNNGFIFPLYLLPDNCESDTLAFRSQPELNFAPAFVRQLADALKVTQSKPHGLPASLTPEDIFHYAYAVFHSPGYRGRYAEFLKVDFPRLPLTGDLELFHALAMLGAELVSLHLLESPKLDKPQTEFIGGRNPEVEKVTYSNNTVWIDKAQTIGFRGVSENVWNFHIGGYQVCQKWLKDRKGRNLSKDDIAHYHKIVIALSETIHLMKEIDKVIEKHGGWPGAFATADEQLSRMPDLERIPLTVGRNYWLEFVVAAFRVNRNKLTLPLLWEAHLIVLESNKYENEMSSTVGDKTQKWLDSLAKEPLEEGVFAEVLQTLVDNGHLKREEKEGSVYLSIAKEIPVNLGEWRQFDAAIVLRMLNSRPQVTSLENLRNASDAGYDVLEKILA